MTLYKTNYDRLGTLDNYRTIKYYDYKIAYSSVFYKNGFLNLFYSFYET